MKPSFLLPVPLNLLTQPVGCWVTLIHSFVRSFVHARGAPHKKPICFYRKRGKNAKDFKSRLLSRNMSDFSYNEVAEVDKENAASVREESLQEAKKTGVRKESGLSDVFSSEKPRDALEGVSSGFGNAVKGIFGGIAMMVAAPIQGGMAGSQEGTLSAVKGAGIGLGMGIVGGAATAVYGVGSGIAQVGRGLVNQSSATIAQMEGCDWDEEKREWILYNLPQDANVVLEIDEERFITNLNAEFRARYDDEVARIHAARQALAESQQDKNIDVDTKHEAASASPETTSASQAKLGPASVTNIELYDVLGVTPGATSVEIKKAYYIAAKASHPDKHPGDVEASAKFVKINEAYMILSNDASRSAYDKGGKDRVDKKSNSSMDAKSLFAMLFGSEDFEPLVGELQLATTLRLGLAAAQDFADKSNAPEAESRSEDDIPAFSIDAISGYGSEYNSRLISFLQRQRIVRCALNLSTKLQPFLDSFSNYTAGDSEGFSEVATKEAATLAATPLGAVLVSIIGVAFVEFARSEQDVFDKMSVSATQVARNMYTKASIGLSGVKSVAASITPTTSSMRKSISSWFSQSEEKTPETKDATESADSNNNTKAESSTKGLSPEEEESMRYRAEVVINSMQVILWRLAELDIRSTTAKICRKVVHDHSVDDLSRKRRVQALRIFGDAFISQGKALGNVNEICAILTSGVNAMNGGTGKDKQAEGEEEGGDAAERA